MDWVARPEAHLSAKPKVNVAMLIPRNQRSLSSQKQGYVATISESHEMRKSVFGKIQNRKKKILFLFPQALTDLSTKLSTPKFE